MTCTSCAARIQEKLNRLDGVEATINYATEKATVRYDSAKVGPAGLVGTIEQTGYTARLPTPPAGGAGTADGAPDEAGLEVSSLRQWLLISATLTLLVLVLASAAQFENWLWLSLTLTAPVMAPGG